MCFKDFELSKKSVLFFFCEHSARPRISAGTVSIIMITCGTFGRLFNHADIVQDILFHVLSGISVSSKERNQTKQKQ